MSVLIGDTVVGEPGTVFVIAEASANHHQSLALAEHLVVAAAEAGANGIKFQSYQAEEIAAEAIGLPRGVDPRHDALFDVLQVKTLRDLLAPGGLPRAWHRGLARLAADQGLAFLSTPFGLDSARFLVEEVGVPALKIASGDLTFLPLLDYAETTGLPVLLSTGASTLDEVDEALVHLDQTYQHGRLALLHCVSCYPCDPRDANLRAMATLRDHAPKAAIGYSDHTLSVEGVPLLAATLGATLIEKHLRLETGPQGADTAHSLTPPQFASMVTALRQLPAILGSGIKEPRACEAHDRLWARRDMTDWLRPTAPARRGAWS